ncbi:hypothetical protein BZP36_03920 [Raoultella terrigena]|nr:hypothetical protein BZP36_03920 [Raoultella terrigena]
MPTSLFQGSIASGQSIVIQQRRGAGAGFREYRRVAPEQAEVCEEGRIAGIKKAPSGAFFIFGVG